MKTYKGSQNSGVAEYEFGKDSIILKFKDGSTYLYTARRPGKAHVDEMKNLAIAGEGLTTYVNKYIRDNYETKLD
jgi:hypothetical protein